MTDLNLAPRQQRTIAERASVHGFGYWSGQDVRVEFRPADPYTGIFFVREDLRPSVRIGAAVTKRIDAPRRTTLEDGGASVEMVEHVMAALAGLQIDNCEVRVTAAEMPGCDGSSQAFVESLLAAGIVAQAAPRKQMVIRDVIRVSEGTSWVEARPSRSGGLRVRCRVQYDHNAAIGEQSIETTVTPEIFCRELADARTFILKEEAEWLRSQGLGQRASYRDLLVFDNSGPIDNTLRYDDECARHKTLDLIGDLALAGCDLVGQVVADRSGHRLNAELVKVLLDQCAVSGSQLRCA
jgi:UDP-3-O-acyl N-acetylglucosamine deacetylase